MSQIRAGNLRGVSETLLLPLYYWAVENRRADGLLHDVRAAQIARRLDYNFARIAGTSQQQVFAILRTVQFDRCAKSFLARHPRGVAVEIGCGLDSRFWRVDNGQVQWFDLDLPPVIQLHRQLLDEAPRCHFIACSMLDLAWADRIRQATGRPFLLLAEGVLPYLAEADFRRFVLGVGAHLGDVELVFDAISPHMLWIHNSQLAGAKLEARLQWGLRRSRDLERWGPRIHLTGEWTYFERPEPRLGWMNRMRSFTPISRAQTILRYTIEGSGSEPGIGQGGEQPMDHEQEQPAHA